MITKQKKKIGRLRRHKRVRKKIIGSKERPRLAVFRSLKNTYAQLIDDVEDKALLTCSTLDKEVRNKAKYGGNIKAASILGEVLLRKAQEKGIKKIVFDRGGYLYHGRVKALAEALRKGGLEF